MSQGQNPDPIAEVARLVDTSLKAANAYERPDLGRRLAALKELVENPGIHVAVCGEFKQGKSTLVNALIAESLCPVDDDVATAVPTFVGWAGDTSAQVTRVSLETDARVTPESITVDQITANVVEHPGSHEHLAERVRISLPSDILRDGLVLIDTPGVGGLTSTHGAATLGTLPFAEAMLFVSDASQEYTEAELTFLKRAIELCPRVLCVLTKIDLHGHWKRILDTNSRHLQREGLDVPSIAVSAELKAFADRTADSELAEESGFGALIEFLQKQVSETARAALVDSAKRELDAVARLLEAPFEAEHAVLSDPNQSAQLLAGLTRAKEESDRLRSAAARWSTTLSDGISDLMSDVQHDLRQRNRSLLKSAESTIDDNDPWAIWAEFEPWLYSRSADEALSNYSIVRDRAEALSSVVAQHFIEADPESLAAIEAFSPSVALDNVSAGAEVDFDRAHIASKGFNAVRSASSGGFMIRSSVGMFLTALNPMGAPMLLASVGLGLVMGRKTLTDEAKRERTVARSQAKQAVRQYLDEVNFLISKDSQDAMRRLQRQLRDHYSERAEELHRSTSEALQNAGHVAEQTKAESEKRLNVVEEELRRIRNHRQRIAGLGLAARKRQ